MRSFLFVERLFKKLNHLCTYLFHQEVMYSTIIFKIAGNTPFVPQKLTRRGCLVLVGIGIDKSPLELIAADPGGPDQHERPADARPRVQFRDLLVRGDLLPVEVVVLGCVIHNLFSFRFGCTMGRFRGLTAG